MDKRSIKTSLAVFLVTILMVSLAGCSKSKIIEAGSTWEIAETTNLASLTIAEGAAIKAPEGYCVTMTVDGVETGQVLETWEGVDYKFAPGAYEGDIVLTVAEANDVAWTGFGGGMSEGEMSDAAGAPEAEMPEAARGPGADIPEGGMPDAAGGPGGGIPGGAGGFGAGMPDAYSFRQALYLDTDGVDYGKSVLAAVQGERPSGFNIQNINIESKGTFYKDPTSPGGTGFNGIYAVGGEYNIKNVEIDFFGDGRSDFVGLGSAIVAAGKGTRLVLDNVTINTEGVVRSGVIAKEESNVIVKNSNIDVKNGVLPPDYAAGANIAQMRSTLWISGMTGTTRATSILGAGTRATYINSTISFEGWGGLSTDIGNASKLTVINCKIDNTGDSGYGQYNNSNAITKILGCEFNIATLGFGSDSGSIFIGDSTQEAVKALNEELELGLTSEEIKSIPVKSTIINSGDQGLLWHGSGCALTITGGTVINTKETTFIDKGAYTDIQVDGSQGARFNPGSGIIMQVIDDDEPPTDPQTNSYGYYEEPSGPVAKDDSHDVYTAKATDALAKFSDIEMEGNFYNAARGGPKNNPMGGGIVSSSRNLGLTFDNASITGVISASDALHYYNGKYYSKIEKEEFKAFSHVINTPSPAVNNGVIVTLTNGSNWTITGTSYLTKLVIEDGSSITAPSGNTLTMTVDDGDPITNITSGSYKGNIMIKVN